MKITRKIFLLLIGIYGASLSQSLVLYPDIKILSSDGNGITLEFRPQYSSDAKIKAEGNEFKLPQFKFGFRSLYNQAGEEDIRTRVVSLAVPGTRNNAVSIIAADYETVNGYSLAPIPEIIPKDNLGAFDRKYIPKFSSRQEFFPQNIASIGNVGLVKGWITANLVLTPMQYQSSTKILRKYTRIVVRVDYGNKESRFDNTGNDEWAKASLLNYTVGKRWATSLPLIKSAAMNSVLSSGTWFKLEIAEDGMYKIDATYLRSLGVDPSSLTSITDIKIFGGDGRALSENLSTPRSPDLPQIAVQYTYGNNSQSTEDDYVLFYGQGTRGWNYNPGSKSYSHYINIYSNSNYYFLAVGANAPIKNSTQVSHAVGNGAKVTSALGKVFFKEERFNFNFSGQNWVSAPFNANDSRVISNKLNGWINGTSVKYEFNLYSRANVNSSFVVEESGNQIATSFFFGMSEGELDSPTANYAEENFLQVSAASSLSDNRSNLKFTFQGNGSTANGFIDWIRIFYHQKLTAQNNELVFHSADTSGFIDYQIDGLTSNDAVVFDISNVSMIKKISHQIEQQLGMISFRDSNSIGSVKRYWAGTPTAFKYPVSFAKLPNSNIHGLNGAEFVIITPGEFKSEAIRLKTHKESLAQSISTVVIDIDTLFNEFGLGTTDPTAIRDLLRYAVENWNVKPKYVLLFGDASFDHKLILGNDRWWVPTIQTAQSNNKISSYNYEDYFSYLDPSNPEKVTIASGRLCPRSVEQAKLIVDKIIAYETRLPKTNWKNVITVVADDLWSTDQPGWEEFNTADSEILAGTFTPDDYEVKRIYTEEYPLIHASAGRRRPEARQAIVDQVNNGTLILNYAGHGNPKVWAHESILTYDDVKSLFTNNDRLTFIVAATCDWGRFDEAGEQSSPEEVMVNKNGGAIGVLSATRAVYADDNAEINQKFYTFLFSGKPVLSLGDAYMQAKNQTSVGLNGNKFKYFLLGDPTLHLAAPRGKITIDSINGKSISQIDTLQALKKVIIKASVRSNDTTVMMTYNGTALVTVYDAEKKRTIPQIPSVTISENGAVIYKGQSSIKNGIMSSEFIVPKDISYDNKNGRLSIYFSNDSSDGRGYTTDFVIGGSSQLAATDSVGPKISIYFDNTSFRSGDVVKSSPILIVALADSSGINSSANAIGHRLEAWIDGSAKSIDLTEFYKGKLDSYQAGTAEYLLSNLSPGNHTIKVRAWDVYNNSSSSEAQFVVAAGEGLSIHNVYNFPNPVSKTTVFTFQHDQLSSIDVTIKIYTVSGRQVQSLESNGYNERFFRTSWDTRDKDGDLIGNGIYLYRVIAKTTDGKYSSEATGKLVIVR